MMSKISIIKNIEFHKSSFIKGMLKVKRVNKTHPCPSQEGIFSFAGLFTTFTLICILAFSMTHIKAQEAMEAKALSPRTANYDIDLVLDTEEHIVNAKEVLYWTNPSSDTIWELQFHLYYNAFRNNESTFMSVRDEFGDLLETEDACKWSWMEVKNMTATNITNSANIALDSLDTTKVSKTNIFDLSNRMKYIQPDDDNAADKTVLSVSLVEPVLPYGKITLSFDWESKVPNIAPRTGYNKDYYFMAQWFPKVGVYEPAGVRGAEKGRWNCHQYHSNGEYYSDFGVYNVKINVPSNFVVGSSGKLVEEKQIDNRTVHHYRAKDVIDFTWTTSPHFVVQEMEWEPESSVGNPVKLKLLTYPGHEHFADRYFTTITNALSYLGEHLGPYPYSALTIVDPPIHGLFTGGMEYPTLISSLSFCFFPKGIKTPETLATHEFVHQYFMQMLATNEQEDPWMDEGFTTYFEGRILDHYEGEKTGTIDVMGIRSGNVEFNRIEFFAMDNPKIADSDRWSWEYENGGYGTIAYNKTALWLRTLEGLIGIETMDEIMRTYFERWKFKHPGGQDFFDIVNEIVPKNHGDKFGENMDWFFEQVFYGTDVCDYKVANIYNDQIRNSAGYFENTDDCITPVQTYKNEDVYKSEVVLHRLGEIILPVDVVIEFEDGTVVNEVWDGKERSKAFKYQKSSKIVSAEIDPERKIYIDKNFINNSHTVQMPKTGIRKYLAQFMVGIQNIMQSLTAFV